MFSSAAKGLLRLRIGRTLYMCFLVALALEWNTCHVAVELDQPRVLVVDHLVIVLKLAEPKQIPFARCILSILGRLGPRQELACVFIQRVSGLAAEFAIIGVPIFLVTIFTKPQGFVGSVGIYVVFYCRYIRAGCGPPSSNFTCTRR